jgi:diketogulonate reductase-like aldo/keto reductase
VVAEIPAVKLPGGIEIPALGLGTWQLKGKQCTEVVQLALQLGYTHIDTAEIYGNQKEIGNAIAGFDRKELFLVSKAWLNHLRFDDVLKACNSTLRDLGTDYLDLYLIHWPNKKVPVQETLKAMLQLKKDGKIRAIGVSNFSILDLHEAEQTGAVIATDQIEMHPLLQQKTLWHYCSLRKIPVTAYSPIARGLVLKNETIQKIAEKHGKTAAQVSLKWLLQKGAIVIPKASSREHLQQNLDVFDWRLSGKEVAEVDAIKKEKRVVSPLLPRIARIFMR